MNKNRVKRYIKQCKICKNFDGKVFYRDFEFLSKFVMGDGGIKSRKSTYNCAKCQRKVALSIDRARNMALIYF